MKATTSTAIFLVVVCAHITAFAALNDARNEFKTVTKIAINDDARCKRDVAQYTETLQFVRQSAGEQVSAKVMSNYVSLDQLNQVVSSAGHCAAAQLLRDKKALR